MVVDEESLGPAMRALTAAQQRFVLALCTMADPTDETSAARLAGYAQPGNGAHFNMRNPKVLAAIREEADKRIRAGALIGARALTEIAMDTQHKQRFQAAQALLDRAGLQVVAVQKIDVTHRDERSNEALIADIRRIAIANGLDPVKLLGQNAIEGEFVEVGSTSKPVTNPGLDDHLFTLMPGEFASAEVAQDRDGPAPEALRGSDDVDSPGE